MFSSFWLAFTILLLAAIFGSIAILPYSLRLLKEAKKAKPLKLPMWLVLVLSVVQNTILFALVIYFGLLAATHLGNGVPFLEGLTPTLFPAFICGIFAGLGLFFADLLFLPYFPEKLLKIALQTTQWENFTASFYGGINEELIMRLFGVSVVTWGLVSIVHQQVTNSFWYANIIMAVIFALGHVPALQRLVGKLSPPMWLRTLLLNIPIGLLCGVVFWNYGIVTAMVTHFIADIVYHVGGTYVLRSRFKKS